MVGLCGRGCRAGRESDLLASSVYLEVEIAARPSCHCSGCFHAGANGIGSATLHPSPGSQRHASDGDASRDHRVLLSLLHSLGVLT